jgi:hypothetical protein
VANEVEAQRANAAGGNGWTVTPRLTMRCVTVVGRTVIMATLLVIERFAWLVALGGIAGRPFPIFKSGIELN